MKRIENIVYKSVEYTSWYYVQDRVSDDISGYIWHEVRAKITWRFENFIKEAVLEYINKKIE